jgi:hypothetical protein
VLSIFTLMMVMFAKDFYRKRGGLKHPHPSLRATLFRAR